MSGIFHEIFFTQISWRGGCIYMECKWGLSVTAVERVGWETWDTFEHSCLLLALPDTARTLVATRSCHSPFSCGLVFSFAERARSLVPDRNRLSSKLWSTRVRPLWTWWRRLFPLTQQFCNPALLNPKKGWSRLSFCVSNVSIDTSTCSTMLIRCFHRKGGHSSYAVQ